jgi:hypothetical protein
VSVMMSFKFNIHGHADPTTGWQTGGKGIGTAKNAFT